MPVLLPCIIIFAIIFKYKLQNITKQEQKAKEQLRQLEQRASLPIKRSLQSLPKITLSLDALPFHDNTTKDIIACQNLIKDLEECTICNLSGMTNLELKLKYGAGNLDTLFEYEQNYLQLIKALSKWGSLLYENHQLEDAKVVLNYAISCKSDLRSTYITLTKIYLEEDNIDEIHALAKKTESISTTLDLKKAIYDTLNEW